MLRPRKRTIGARWRTSLCAARIVLPAILSACGGLTETASPSQDAAHDVSSSDASIDSSDAADASLLGWSLIPRFNDGSRISSLAAPAVGEAWAVDDNEFWHVVGGTWTAGHAHASDGRGVVAAAPGYAIFAVQDHDKWQWRDGVWSTWGESTRYVVSEACSRRDKCTAAVYEGGRPVAGRPSTVISVNLEDGSYWSTALGVGAPKNCLECEPQIATLGAVHWLAMRTSPASPLFLMGFDRWAAAQNLPPDGCDRIVAALDSRVLCLGGSGAVCSSPMDCVSPCTWSCTPTPPFVASGFWAATSTSVWIVGAHGAIAHWDGAIWTQFPSLVDEALEAIAGSSDSDLWVGGDHGSVLHYGPH